MAKKENDLGWVSLTFYLTSHAFVKNFKRYARDAGVREVQQHQTQHTSARIV
jgi:hypothetical protein